MTQPKTLKYFLEKYLFGEEVDKGAGEMVALGLVESNFCEDIASRDDVGNDEWDLAYLSIYGADIMTEIFGEYEKAQTPEELIRNLPDKQTISLKLPNLEKGETTTSVIEISPALFLRYWAAVTLNTLENDVDPDYAAEIRADVDKLYSISDNSARRGDIEQLIEPDVEKCSFGKIS